MVKQHHFLWVTKQFWGKFKMEDVGKVSSGKGHSSIIPFYVGRHCRGDLSKSMKIRVRLNASDGLPGIFVATSKPCQFFFKLKPQFGYLKHKKTCFSYSSWYYRTIFLFFYFFLYPTI